MTKKFDHGRKRQQDKRASKHVEKVDVSDIKQEAPETITDASTGGISTYKYLAGFMAIVVAGFAGHRFTRSVEQTVTLCKDDDIKIHIKTDTTLVTLGPCLLADAEKDKKPKPQPKGKEKVNDKEPKAKDKKKQGTLAGLAGISGLLWMWRNRRPSPDPDKPPRDPSNGFELIKRFLQWYLAETQVKWEMWRPMEFVRGCVRRGACKIQMLPIAPVQCYYINNVLEKAVKISKYTWGIPLLASGVSVTPATVDLPNKPLQTSSDSCVHPVQDNTSKPEDGQGVKLVYRQHKESNLVNGSDHAERVDTVVNSVDHNVLVPKAQLMSFGDVLSEMFVSKKSTNQIHLPPPPVHLLTTVRVAVSAVLHH